MKVFQFSLGQLQANCYFLIEGEECLIIDPADEASFILEELQRRKLKLAGMLATHGHFDHVMAVGEIQKSINVPLSIKEDDLFLIDRLAETAKYFLGYKPVIIKPVLINRLINTKSEIGKFNFEIIKVPGHTPGSCCYLFKKDIIIFTGDTLFKRGIGRYDFSYSNKKELKNSLQKILKLAGETVVYPGHGESTTIEAEKEFVHSII